MNTNIETLIVSLAATAKHLRAAYPNQLGVDADYIDQAIAALRQADQQSQTLRAAVIEECRQKIIDLRLPDCEWEKKYNDRFDDGVKAAIHQLNALLNPVEEIERYDCPIHGLQDGPDCPRC